MTVGELLEALRDQPAGRLVVLSSDAEGNSHSPLADVAAELYDAETSYSGEIYPLGDDEAPADAVQVVLLTPVN